MNWNEYKTYHREKYGSSSRHDLSRDYNAYKTKEHGHRSPTRHNEHVNYEHVLATMPQSRHYKTRQLQHVAKNRYEGRGSPTRGWAAMSPQRGRERHELKAKCGNRAFLEPENEGFPVMSASRVGEGCHYNCKGIQSAYNRANQYKHFDIARKAENLGRTHCGWSPSRSRSPMRSPPRMRY